MHFDGQLRASHLILSCVPSYTSYQDPRSTLTVGSPLMSHIDIRLPRFLPRGLTVGEAQERGPRFIREDSLMPTRDGLVDLVFHGKFEHIPIKDPIIPELAKDMVQRCNMSLERWFPGA